MFNTSIVKKMKHLSNFTSPNSTKNYPTINSSNTPLTDDADAVYVSPLITKIDDDEPNKKTSVAQKIEKNKNTYAGLKKLQKKPVSELQVENNVEICVFQIKYLGKSPFLLYNLFKNNQVLTWPTMNIQKVNMENIIDKVKKNFDAPEMVVTYEGYYDNNDAKQLWFRYSDNTTEATLCKYHDNYIWCLCSEIVNDQKYLTFNIDQNVVQFFIKNPDFLYIKNNLGNLYETPVVAYYGNSKNNIAYTATFGRTKSAHRRYGSHYYFRRYEEAIKYAVWTMDNKPKMVFNKSLTINNEGKYERGGLVRFVLFLKHTKVFLDTEDDIEKKTTTTLIDNSTKKSRDVDDDWTSMFDSVMNGAMTQNIAGQTKNIAPVLVVKKYEQQMPLTYYYVNTAQKLAEKKTNTTPGLIVE